MKFLRMLARVQKGATAIEYALIAALVAVASISALGALSNSLSITFNTVATNMSNANDGQL